jgi:DedD protein
MPKSISEEELQLRKRARRRLVGAIALVTIVAVFLPMVLDHEPKPVSQDVSIKIPSPDAGVFTSKIVPVAPAQKPAPAPKAEVPVQPERAADNMAARIDAPKVAAAVPSAKSAAQPSVTSNTSNDSEAAPPKPSPDKPAAFAKQPADKPKVADKEKAADKNKATGKGGAGYVIQLAALNDPDKAKQMRDQITASGVKAYTEVVPTAKGKVTRVRAGPFGSRPDADKARDKLKALGLSGNVVPK